MAKKPTPAAAAESVAESVVGKVEHAAKTVAHDVEQVAEDVEHQAITLADAVIHMVHPEGGTTDAYEADKSGVIAVPAADVATMQSHGFVPAEQD